MHGRAHLGGDGGCLVELLDLLVVGDGRKLVGPLGGGLREIAPTPKVREGQRKSAKARRAMRGSCMGRYMGRYTGDARGEPHLIDEVDHAEAEEEVHQHEHEHRQRVEVGPRLDHLGLEGAGEDTATAEGKHAWV